MRQPAAANFLMDVRALDLMVVAATVLLPASDAAVGWWRRLRGLAPASVEGPSSRWVEPKGFFWHVGNAPP
jgi:hypothetical protein